MGENSGLHSARSFPSAYELLSLACGHVTSVYSISATLTINITSAVVKVGHMESRWVHQHLDHEMYTENPGHAAMFSLERFNQEVIENTFIVLFFRLLFLSQHLSGFIMDRRIPWRKANCIGVFYFRLIKQASSAHLNTVDHFTFKKLNIFLVQYCSLWVHGACRMDLAEDSPCVHQYLPNVVMVPPPFCKRSLHIQFT